MGPTVCYTKAMPEILLLTNHRRLFTNHIVTADQFTSVTEGTGWQTATTSGGDQVNVYRPTTDELVKRIRSFQATIRTRDRNSRLGYYQGRNGGGDTSGYRTAVDLLISGLPRRLQGLLTSEHKLAARISENRDAGHERPELATRLLAIRREIKAAVHA